MEENKPTLIFTTFWDADSFLRSKCLLLNINDKVYKLNFTESNFKVYSIALSHPEFQNKSFQVLSKIDVQRLDFFCPKYKALQDYKKDKNWDVFASKYKALLKERKEETNKFLTSLRPNSIHVFCCWEKTSEKTHCHRQIIYEGLKKSSHMKDRFNLIYRGGKDFYENKVLEHDMVELMPIPNPNFPAMRDLRIVENTRRTSWPTNPIISASEYLGYGTPPSRLAAGWTIEEREGIGIINMPDPPNPTNGRPDDDPF